MAEQYPVKGVVYEFDVSLESVASSGHFQVNPTLAAGDVQVSKDGGALANLATLPTVTPAGGRIVRVQLSATEMDADKVTVVFADAAGDEWLDLIVAIQTRVQRPSDAHARTLLALPAAAADAAGGLPISDAGGLDLDAKLAATNEITAARMAALADWIDGGRLDLILDAIAGDVVNLDGAAMRGTDGAYTGTPPTTAQIRDAILDRILAGNHDAGGSTGALVQVLSDWLDAGRLDLLLDAIKAKTDLITAGGTTVVSPVAADGDVTIERGDDYAAADSRALEWTSSAWPDLTGATVVLKLSGALSFSATVPVAGVGSQTVRVELTDTQTLTIPAGVRTLELEATLVSGRIVSLVRGKATVRASVA